MPELDERVTLAKQLSLTIQSDDDYKLVASALGGIVGLQKQVDETFKPIINAARATLDAARSRRAEYMDPLVDQEKKAKAAMVEWLHKRSAPPSIEERVFADDEQLARAVEPPPKLDSVAAVRKVFTFEMVNANFLRPEYRVPDLTAVGRIVRAIGPAAVEAVSLPNCMAIKVNESTTVAARRR